MTLFVLIDVGAELHQCFIKKEPKIETVCIRECPSETADALGFTPIGLDEPYKGTSQIGQNRTASNNGNSRALIVS